MQSNGIAFCFEQKQQQQKTVLANFFNNPLLPEAFPTSDDFGASRNSAYAFFSYKNNF